MLLAFLPAVRLRAVIWKSVFTHDMRRYRRALDDRMEDFTTLITSPTGTGTGRAARALGLSRDIPCAGRDAPFAEGPAGLFRGLNGFFQ